MDGPRRKITAKVNPDAVPSPVPTRPPSQASNILDASSLSSPAAIRPKAKLSAGATASSLKPTVPKSGGSTVASGRKTPASSVAGRTTRERPASLISAPAARSTASSQPASPMNPSMSTRRPRSPQPPRGASPMSRITARRIKSPEPPPMSPSPSNPRRGLAPSPAPASGSTLSRRATSPSVRSTRPRESPVPVPPLTIPRRGASPTRPSPFNHNSQPLRNRTTSHRRIASASSALSGSSVAPAPLPEPTKPRVLQSLSAITLDGPPPFSAIPKSPPRSAQPDLSFPSPSPSPSLSPLPAADPPEPSIESQDDDSSSASIEQSEEASQSSTPPSATPPVPSIPLITSSAPATPSHIEVTSAPLDLTSSSATLVVQDTPLIASSAPVTPSYVQPTPPRPRTSSVSLAPHPPNNLLSNLASGMRITAKVSPATLAAASASARSSSGGSTISGIAPSMISGMSSIRVGANSRILSPPPDRRIPFVGLNLQGSTFPVPIGSPPASIVSSMSSASRHSRSTSFSRHSRSGSFADGARTPTDVGLRPRLSGGGASALGIAIEDEGGGGVERDDSGIDMFEADDGEEHHGQREARSNRKIADLEISNKSLLAINASLEATKARQAKEIRDLRRKLRESRLVLPPKTFAALEESDPLKDSGSASSSNSDSDDNDVTQTQADETFDRVRQMLDQMIEGAKQALETGTVKLSEKASGGPSIRVLNKMDVHGEENGTEEEEESEDESEESEDSEESEEDDADSAMGELSSIDGVSPMEEHPPVRVGANAKIIEAGSGAGGGTFSAITSSLGPVSGVGLGIRTGAGVGVRVGSGSAAGVEMKTMVGVKVETGAKVEAATETVTGAGSRMGFGLGRWFGR